MHWKALLVMFLLGTTPLSAMADNQPVTHDTDYVYPAYDGDAQGNIRTWSGYALPESSDTASYAGVLLIDPGGGSWENFVSAAQAWVSYEIADVTLVKQTPAHATCSETFPARTITQTLAGNIRTNWPLMYEVPGTTWTLTVNYVTFDEWDDDGPNRPNVASTTHSEVFRWELQADPWHLSSLLRVLHDVEVGTSGVPAISDEALHPNMVGLVEQAKTAWEAGDLTLVAMSLADCELLVMDACTAAAPSQPYPTGPDTGIVNTDENPACCKLLMDIEFILSHMGMCSPPSLHQSPRPASTSSSSLNGVVGHSANARSAFYGDSGGNPVRFRGLAPDESGMVAFPGVLGIEPGNNWCNFVRAAQLGMAYTLGSITLVKQTPQHVLCADVMPARTITQEGSSNIRLWWPLMYEPAGTTWTLMISYGTAEPWDDDGDGTTTLTHIEKWEWRLDDGLFHLSALCDLLHGLPFGISEVPLISDEELYPLLEDGLDTATVAYGYGATEDAAGWMLGFEWGCDGAGIGVGPGLPNPIGPGTGIAATDENPATCKLMTSAEWVRDQYGMGAAPGIYARAGNTVLTRMDQAYSACEGGTPVRPRAISGYATTAPSEVVYPGSFSIDPGSNWENFVTPQVQAAGYSIESIGLIEEVPYSQAGRDWFPNRRLAQAGADNMRLHWPLVDATPGTTWAVTVVTATATPVGDGWLNPPSYLHALQWIWHVDTDLPALTRLVRLFHDIPGGTSETPVISDEALYARLLGYLGAAQVSADVGDMVGLAAQLDLFDSDVRGAWLFDAPSQPSPSGVGTGVLGSPENPAAARLLVDTEYIRAMLGIPTEPLPIVSAKRRATTKPAVAAAARKAASDVGAISHPTLYVPSASSTDTGSGVVSVPGVAAIVPGANWSNFIAAARSSVAYTLDDVVLTKTSPASASCPERFQTRTVVQAGTDSIRLWWPLLYELPGAAFTLEVAYTTAEPCQFAGEKSASTEHREIWRWQVYDELDSLRDLVGLMHDLPFGVSDTPLISDEWLNGYLADRLLDARSALALGELADVRTATSDFGLAAREGCIGSVPDWPNPTGPGTGIANTVENPAGCRLVIGSEGIVTVSRAAISDLVKDAPDGAAVELTEPKIATLVQPGFFYSQDEDRTCGLKAIGTAGGLQAGGTVLLRGVMGTEGPERVLRLAGYEIETASGALPGPLGMLNCNIGGPGRGYLPGFLGEIGVWNGGLRVTVTGLVTAAAEGHFRVSDGSGVPSAGLRITLMPGVDPPEVGAYARVTGISAWFDSSGLPEPAVLVGSAGDMTTFQ